MKLTKNGRPEKPCMKQGRDPSKVSHPTRVKDHTVWCHEKKPWTNYVHKVQHYSIEAHYLYRKVKELGVGNYANLGVFRGGSVNCMAVALEELNGGKIYGVDLFEGANGACYVEELEQIFSDNGRRQYVEFCQGYTHEWPKKLSHLKFKFIFVDADHYYETCKQDFELWNPLLEPGGQISFHDVNMKTVDKVLTEMEADCWEMVDHYGRIKTFKRKEKA